MHTCRTAAREQWGRTYGDYLVRPSIPSGNRYKISETLTDHRHPAWCIAILVKVTGDDHCVGITRQKDRDIHTCLSDISFYCTIHALLIESPIVAHIRRLREEYGVHFGDVEHRIARK